MILKKTLHSARILVILINGIIWFTYMLTALGFTAPVLSGYLVGIILNLKELTYEKLFMFDYQILISKDNPLKNQDIYMKDLKKQIELKHGDIHIQEDHHNHKHMNIYERGIQFELLSEIPETYMWVAPMPKKLLKQNHFVLKECKDKKIPYVDYLIYRKGYILSKEDQNFIECLKNVIEQVK